MKYLNYTKSFILVIVWSVLKIKQMAFLSLLFISFSGMMLYMTFMSESPINVLMMFTGVISLWFGCRLNLNNHGKN